VLNRFDQKLKKIEKIQIAVSWLVTLFVTLMLVTDILLRFLFNYPLRAAWETSEVLMPYIVMFGFAHTLTTNVHVRVSLVTDRFPKKIRSGFETFGYLLSLTMCVLLTYWSWLRFWESFVIGEEILAAVRIPWWIGKLGMPLSFATFGGRYLLLVLEKVISRPVCTGS
jgi:TRAP-type mannitol/chloroaromatic compound transport system permease small subunit